MNGGTRTAQLIDVPPLRWSSVRDCPRKAVYEATGAPARERYPKEERILFRGKTLGRDYADFLAAAHGEDAIERERKVVWPLGVGHIDVYVKETRTVVEVLSSANASTEMVRSKLVQAVGYATFDPDADNVCLVILNPSDYSEERVVVTPESPQWADLVAEVHARVAQVLAWRDGGEIPGRVCRKPADAYGHFCLHAAHCFDGYEPDPLAQLDDPDTHQLVARLYHAKQAEREVKQTLAVLEQERKEIEAELDGVVEPGKFQVGGYQINKSPRRRESFKLSLAKQDSRIPAVLLEEFTSVSDFVVWSVDKNGQGDIDAGPVPF